jgi:hypothetical protein
MITGSVGEVLGDAQVAFRGLNGGMSERELDLFQGHAAFVRQLGEGAADVVGARLTPSCRP